MTKSRKSHKKDHKHKKSKKKLRKRAELAQLVNKPKEEKFVPQFTDSEDEKKNPVIKNESLTNEPIERVDFPREPQLDVGSIPLLKLDAA